MKYRKRIAALLVSAVSVMTCSASAGAELMAYDEDTLLTWGDGENDIADDGFDIRYHTDDDGDVGINGDMVFLDKFCLRITDPEKKEACITSYIDDGSETVVVNEKIGGFTVIGIEPYAFYGAFAKRIILPDTVRYLGEKAFLSCAELEEINIPENVYIILRNTFEECYDLKKVRFHDGIKLISSFAFEFSVNVVPPDYADRVFTAYSERKCGDWLYKLRVIEDAPYAKAYLTRYLGDARSLRIPDTIDEYDVEGVSENVFLSEKGETEVPRKITIPSEITEIDVSGFNFTGLEELVFEGDDITVKGDISDTFIEKLELPVRYADGYFLTLPETVKEVRFTGPHDLTIGERLFEGIDSLGTVSFSPDIRSITLETFSLGSTCLREFRADVPSAVYGKAFMGSNKLENVVFSSDAYFKAEAFDGCDSLKTMTVGGKLNMDRFALRKADALENIFFDLYGEFDAEGFEGCLSLKKINGITVFDEDMGDICEEYKDIVYERFSSVEDVGFINDYVMYNVKKIVSEIITDDMSDMEKVKAIHDWVCAHTEYADDDPEQGKYHTDSSILMNDTTVCEGYAKLCNLLFHEAGLETYCVMGIDHIWNVVNVGGQFFHFDSTWDDVLRSYDWFLRSDDQIISDNAHSSWKLYSLSELHSFQGHNIPECSRKMGDVNGDGELTAADLVMLSRCVVGAEILPENEAVLYDLSYDGRIDAFDAAAMRRLIIREQ